MLQKLNSEIAVIGIDIGKISTIPFRNIQEEPEMVELAVGRDIIISVGTTNVQEGLIPSSSRVPKIGGSR